MQFSEYIRIDDRSFGLMAVATWFISVVTSLSTEQSEQFFSDWSFYIVVQKDRLFLHF